MTRNFSNDTPFAARFSRNTMQLKYAETTKNCDGILYQNGYLYVSSGTRGGSFQILKCGEGAPQLLSELNGLGALRQLAISADLIDGRVRVAMTARESGVYIVDATDAANPFICCHYDTVEFATGIAFVGSILAICCRSFGVELLSVENPTSPRHISTVRAGEVQSIFIENGILYTGSWGEMQVKIGRAHV